MTPSKLLPFALLLTLPALAQHVRDPHASLIDVPAQQAILAHSTSLAPVIDHLPSCVKTGPIPAPTGRMIIPHHYLSGSSGPTDPAEHIATRLYESFETRVTAGMNRYLATGSHAESACALAQLDAWAQAGALLDYDREESSQAWYQVEWTLSSVGISDSVLVNDATLDPAQQKRVTDWLDKAAHKDISFEKPNDTDNNHHYWRGLAAMSIGVTADDAKLFRFGIDTYKEAISEIDKRGAFPKEMARHENAIHYQAFALAPLVMIAQFASRQGVDLFAFQSHDRSIRDAIVFFGNAAADPTLVKPYTNDQQKLGFGGGDFAPFAFFVARFGAEGLPPNIISALQHPASNTRIGGNVFLMAATAD